MIATCDCITIHAKNQEDLDRYLSMVLTSKLRESKDTTTVFLVTLNRTPNEDAVTIERVTSLGA